MMDEELKSSNLVRLVERGVSPMVLLGIGVLVVVLAGLGLGYFLSQKSGISSSLPSGKIEVAPGAKVGKNVAGLEDEKTFRDRAEGVIENGGLEGEGTHHLVREGGPSQYVYLTSSVINLDPFVGKKVEVWGETNKGQKAGWLMDVGKVKLIE